MTSPLSGLALEGSSTRTSSQADALTPACPNEPHWAIDGEDGEQVDQLRAWLVDGTAAAIRLSAGLTLDALATCLDVPAETARKIEDGETSEFDVALRYARLLHSLYPLASGR